MSRLTDLLRQARKADPQLGADLEAEVAALTKRRTFGLVFEQHQPEAVELPSRGVRRGDKVRVLPPRGDVSKGNQRLWRVLRIERVDGERVAHLEEVGVEEPETQAVLADDLVAVAEFQDTIYPGLVETGRVERGGDKPFHTVINGENFHALEMLTYTHRHAIDAIYIDPPYNTGARDWKYNNNYVEGDDDYRHSKWLAFMERRLLITRELLDPEDSVLIVTIDEKEYLRLGLLLEQTFPEARIQMVSIAMNARVVARGGEFGRNNEFAYFVMMGDAAPEPVDLGRQWLANSEKKTVRGTMHWTSLSRTAADGYRTSRPGGFYPVYVHQDGSGIHSIGDAIALDQAQSADAPVETIAVWPMRSDGREGRWQLNPATARDVLSQGFMRSGPIKNGRAAIYYVKSGEREKVSRGEYKVEGYAPDGSIITSATTDELRFLPSVTWNVDAHDAGVHGSRLLNAFLPNRRFPFPKSLYAVEDALRFFVHSKKEAVIIDFFSGSGTTAHAIMRLNRQDGGRRRSISVTNNEVSANEQGGLRAKGLRPGDPEWEALGICDYITKPRVTAAITGRTPQGEPIKGDYKFTDEFPMADGFEENAVFFTLTYESPLSVRHNRAFERVAPMLWLRAGSQGRIITSLGERGWDVADTYGVLENLDRVATFIQAVAAQARVRQAFIVTDDDSAFQMVCRELPAGILPVRLYESYLQNFEINTGRTR